MKTRSDFVSNSSSCSFVFPYYDLKKVLVSVRNKTCKFPQFTKYISYFDGFIFKKHFLTTQLIEFLELNYNSFVHINTDVLFNNRLGFIEKYPEKFGVTINSDGNYFYKDKIYPASKIGDLTDKIIKDFDFIDTSESYFIDNEAEFSIIEFSKTLNDDDFVIFCNNIVCCYSHKSTDSQPPPELDVFVKYNNDLVSIN